MTFPKAYLGLIFWIFFSKFELVFAVSALFHDQLLCFCMSSVTKMNISLTMLVMFQFRRFRQTFFGFSDNTFPIEMVVTKLFQNISRIWFIHKHTWLLRPSWNTITSSKMSPNLDYYFRIFWKALCSTTLMQSFIARAWLFQDLWSGNPFIPPFPPSRLFNVKKAQAGYV